MRPPLVPVCEAPACADVHNSEGYACRCKKWHEAPCARHPNYVSEAFKRQETTQSKGP